MKVEFDGLYQKHEILTSKTGNEYIKLSCIELPSNRSVNIFMFDLTKLDNLKNLKQNDNVVVIFSVYYSIKQKKDKIIALDVIPV